MFARVFAGFYVFLQVFTCFCGRSLCASVILEISAVSESAQKNGKLCKKRKSAQIWVWDSPDPRNFRGIGNFHGISGIGNFRGKFRKRLKFLVKNGLKFAAAYGSQNARDTAKNSPFSAKKIGRKTAKNSPGSGTPSGRGGTRGKAYI